MTRRRETWLVLGIFLFALVARLRFDWPAITGEQLFGFGDDVHYYSMAVSLLEMGELRQSPEGFVAYRMPFLSMLLAANYAIFGTAPNVAIPFLVILSALTCVGVYWLGKELFNSQVGLLASLLCSLDFGLIYYSQYLSTETLFVFLVLTSMIALERLRKNQRWQTAVITGLLMSMATLTRVNFAVFVPIALVGIIGLAKNNRTKMLKDAIIICALVLAIWSVWIIRNYAETGAFIPLTTQSGNGYLGIYNDDAIADSNPLLYGIWTWVKVARPPSYSPAEWTEVAADLYQRNLAIDWIRSHPNQAVLVALSQALHFWEPEIAADFYYVPFLLVAGIIGFVRAVRQGNQGVWLWAWLAATLTLFSIISVAVPRFRLPMHTGLSVLASFAIITSWQKIRAKRTITPNPPSS